MGAGRCSDWLRRRPLPAPRAPRHAPSPLLPSARSWFPLEGGRAGAGPVSPPRTRPGRRGDKTWAAARERVRLPLGRGEAGPRPSCCPRPCPSDPTPGAGRPARRHSTAGAPRRYLQPSNEESPGEPRRAGGDVFCARGCCRRRCCLKLPKLRASERLPPPGSKRERNSEDAGVTDKRTDLPKTPRRRPIPGVRKASQLCGLCSGRVACQVFPFNCL